eukprot:symbB.v1.2.009317.t2/scaffold585.1/size314277/7
MFSPTDWEKLTPDEEVSAASPGQALQLVKALQRVQRLEGTELSLADLNLHCLEPLLEVQVLPRHVTLLSLRGNPWQDPTALVSHLQPLQQLTSLDLSCCTLALENLQLFLPSLPRLRVLRLEQNGLKSTEGIARCPKLMEVNLAQNQLTCTDHLEMLLELRVLDLSQNLLTSIQHTLRPLTACKNLWQLKLQGNPLAKVFVSGTLRSLFPALEVLDDRPLRRRKPVDPSGTADPVHVRFWSVVGGSEMEDLTPLPAPAPRPTRRYTKPYLPKPRGSFTPPQRKEDVARPESRLQSTPLASPQSAQVPLQSTCYIVAISSRRNDVYCNVSPLNSVKVLPKLHSRHPHHQVDSTEVKSSSAEQEVQVEQLLAPQDLLKLFKTVAGSPQDALQRMTLSGMPNEAQWTSALEDWKWGLSKKEIASIFHGIDVDNDGKVDLGELLSCFRHGYQGEIPAHSEAPPQQSSRYDCTDGLDVWRMDWSQEKIQSCSLISVMDLREHLRPQITAAEMVHAADLDGDGAISQAEWTAAATRGSDPFLKPITEPRAEFAFKSMDVSQDLDGLGPLKR